jgi:Cu+-exporting ATPase
MEKVIWKVEGMTCSNCALTVNKFLEKEGMRNVKVSLLEGMVAFEPEGDMKTEQLSKGIEALGYKVVKDDRVETASSKKINRYLSYFLFCLPFTLVLMLHMLHGVLQWHWLMNGWIQLALCLPVYIVGMSFFGKSAIKSIRNGMPNMNVLIALGSTAAFAYSLTGTLLGLGENYLFYETAAAIITLVFLGNYLEDLSMQSTQKALKSLVKSQRVRANMIAFDDQHQEQIFQVDNTQLRPGDLILIRTGEQVPADCKILWGEASVNEAIITGESMPVSKVQKNSLIGGSILIDGTLKAQVTAEASRSVLANIINLVKQAQGEKPPLQQLADRISAIFVPLVLGLALVSFLVNYFVLQDFTTALMRSIAVLVVACPCAMGLATPAAIAVGLGRAARSGILFRHARSLELFKNIRQVVFDKTGTLTTGSFRISSYRVLEGEEESFKRIAYSLEKYSNHPVAQSIVSAWRIQPDIRWSRIEEVKGMGVKAASASGDEYWAGSFRIAETLTDDLSHHVYIVRNDHLMGWIDLKDELRPEAGKVVDTLRKKGMKIILLTGDRLAPSKDLAAQLQIDEVIAEQSPAQKLARIQGLSETAPTVMVGDGINDAPALAKATIGIAMSDASHIAVQTADLVLMNNGLKQLPHALNLGKHTFITVKQNLFWAFIYNIIAIPFAAFGFLSPTFAALLMGLSDVVLAINSVRLYVKKVD